MDFCYEDNTSSACCGLHCQFITASPSKQLIVHWFSVLKRRRLRPGSQVCRLKPTKLPKILSIITAAHYKKAMKTVTSGPSSCKHQAALHESTLANDHEHAAALLQRRTTSRGSHHGAAHTRLFRDSLSDSLAHSTDADHVISSCHCYIEAKQPPRRSAAPAYV